jgi:hypothetical protein
VPRHRAHHASSACARPHTHSAQTSHAHVVAARWPSSRPRAIDTLGQARGRAGAITTRAGHAGAGGRTRAGRATPRAGRSTPRGRHGRRGHGRPPRRGRGRRGRDGQGPPWPGRARSGAARAAWPRGERRREGEGGGRGERRGEGEGGAHRGRGGRRRRFRASRGSGRVGQGRERFGGRGGG